MPILLFSEWKWDLHQSRLLQCSRYVWSNLSSTLIWCAWGVLTTHSDILPVEQILHSYSIKIADWLTVCVNVTEIIAVLSACRFILFLITAEFMGAPLTLPGLITRLKQLVLLVYFTSICNYQLKTWKSVFFVYLFCFRRYQVCMRAKVRILKQFGCLQHAKSYIKMKDEKLASFHHFAVLSGAQKDVSDLTFREDLAVLLHSRNTKATWYGCQ